MTVAGPPLRRPARWKYALLVALTGVLVFAVVRWLGGAAALGDALARARWALLPVVLALSVVQLMVATHRWRLIVRSMDCPLTLGQALRIVLGTWPLAAVTPSRVTDVLRAWPLRDRLPLPAGIGSVILEKLIDVQSLCILGGLGLALTGMWAGAGLALAALLALWTGMLVAMRFRAMLLALPGIRRARPKLERLYAALDAVGSRRRALLTVAASSIASWLLAGAMLVALLEMMGADVRWDVVLAFWPAAIFVGLLPVSMAGMGTRDAAFVLLLRRFAGGAVDESAVLAATLAYAVVGTWLWALVGLPFTFRMNAAPAAAET